MTEEGTGSVWIVQRSFGDEWRSIAPFGHRSIALRVLEAWHGGGGEHPGYRVVAMESPPIDLALDQPTLPDRAKKHLEKTARAGREAAERLLTIFDPRSAADRKADRLGADDSIWDAIGDALEAVAELESYLESVRPD